MSEEKAFKNKVLVFNFILTMLVIYVHSVNIAPEVPSQTALFVYRTEDLLSNVIGQTAVPGFFMISAYLFFRNCPESPGIGFFINKYKKRARTLLVPYLLWNALYLIINIAVMHAELSPSSVLSGIFLYRYNPVFWYMLQLLILTVLTPAIWLLLSRKPAAAAVCLLMYLLAANYRILPFHIVNEDALFYYSLGAAASLHLKKYIEKSSNQRAVYPLIAASVLLIIFGSSYDELNLYTVIGLRAALPVWIFTYLSFNASYGFPEFESEMPGFLKIGFFIYAMHFMIVRGLIRVLTAALSAVGISADSAAGASMLLIEYLLLPATAAVVSYVIAEVLKRYAPRLYGIITGDR